MKIFLASFIYFFIIITINFPFAFADLKSDKQALLDFAVAVPHLRKLNWNSTSSICNSWVGVTCNLNRTRVSELRLPGVGLVGHIPPNTIGKLDALRVLSLRSNVLEAHCSGSLIQFFHRQHSSNISKFNTAYWVEPPK